IMRLSSTETRAAPRSIAPRPAASAFVGAAIAALTATAGLVFGSDQSSIFLSPFLRCSLAGFAFGIVDGAGLAPRGIGSDRDGLAGGRGSGDDRGHRVQLAVGALQR